MGEQTIFEPDRAEELIWFYAKIDSYRKRQAETGFAESMVDKAFHDFLHHKFAEEFPYNMTVDVVE